MKDVSRSEVSPILMSGSLNLVNYVATQRKTPNRFYLNDENVLIYCIGLRQEEPDMKDIGLG